MRSRSCSEDSRDAGTVTAEAAVALPVLLLALGLVVYVLVGVAAQVRCVDAARAAARLAARGEVTETVRAAGQALAPRGARVTVRSSGEHVEVVVSTEVSAPGPVLGRLGALTLSGRAVALVEPGASP